MQPATVLIDARREDSGGQKQLRFTVPGEDDFTVDQVYGIKHVIGLEPFTDHVSVSAETQTIMVGIRPWQEVNEALARRLGKAIGDALGYLHKNIHVDIGKMS